MGNGNRRAGENLKNLNRLRCELTKASTPIYPIANRVGVRWSPHLPPPSRRSISIPSELHKIVLRLAKTKAPGPDSISTAALRHLPRRAMVAMNRVFKGIVRTSHFLETWKRGENIEVHINTIQKAGKEPHKPENLRLITLLSPVAKTFESDLLRKLRPFLSSRQEQYGFRSGHSTALQLIRVLHYLASEKNCGRYTVAVLFDIEKPLIGCGTMAFSTNYWLPHCHQH
ncbi:Probable RNA-directed DNA polymerase from transposon X-element [Eumeta japonica]|uniref:Probable RNA-directed DNA polymerase from transposon X-element n=1 Tax=Eumeta variegata TaxID=151549 RepID=A0A4C1V847_EUMVA|nr:Probable RNA-directed DNA polymerase from transposon X-element [Eumeta japonica]